MKPVSFSLKRWRGNLVDYLTEAQRQTLEQMLRSHQEMHNESDETMNGVRSWINVYQVWENGRATSRFGCVSFANQTLELHSALFQKGMEKHHDDTLMHELAHIVAFHLGKDRGHGQFWKNVAKQLGAKPDRCGPLGFDLGREAKLKVIYECETCGCLLRRTRRWHGERFHMACASGSGVNNRPTKGWFKLISTTG